MSSSNLLLLLAAFSGQILSNPYLVTTADGKYLIETESQPEPETGPDLETEPELETELESETETELKQGGMEDYRIETEYQITDVKFCRSFPGASTQRECLQGLPDC